MTSWPAGDQEAAHGVPPSSGGAWRPDPAWSAPPARPPGPSASAFFAVLLLVLGLVVAGLQFIPAGTPSTTGPTRTASTPVATTEPSAGASRSAKPNTSTHPRLTDNAIYHLTVSGNCGAIDKVASRTAYKKQVSALLDCLQGIFHPLVDEADGDYSVVDHIFYTDQVDTPCGRQSDAYAFYCETNETIYLSGQVYTDSQYARLAVADTVIHEFGHHVQAMMGIFDEADDLGESRTVTVRREELQVYCWTYYVFASVRSFALTDADRTFFMDLWSHTSDPEGHGSTKAQQYWGPRGLSGGNLGACNTWSVPKASVR